jgi:hypothetical protein
MAVTPSEQARADASHPCDACGGSGVVDARGAGRSGPVITSCPVCQGSGRISDRVPVSDSLADADALRLCASRLYGKGCQGFVRNRLIEADMYGCEARGWSKQEPVGRYAGWDTAAIAADKAKRAARAAFRACPGLRGGR